MNVLNVMSCELKKNSSSSSSQENQLELRANSNYFDTSMDRSCYVYAIT